MSEAALIIVYHRDFHCDECVVDSSCMQRQKHALIIVYHRDECVVDFSYAQRQKHTAVISMTVLRKKGIKSYRLHLWLM